MTIRKASRKGKREIDLRGPQGNAFVLLGIAEDMAKQLSLDPKPIMEAMKSSDYENLIEVFDFHFGKYIDLIREE